MNNETRTNRQSKGKFVWRDANGNGVLEYFPGFGKTKVAADIVDEMSQKKHTPTLVIVHSNLMQQQWTEILIDLGLTNWKVEVIHRIVIPQLVPAGYRLVIFDELHKYLKGALFSTIFSLTKSIRFRLGLTGTLSKEEKEILLALGFPIIDTITLEEGKRNEWCSPIKEYNLGIALPQDEQQLYTSLYEEFASYYSGFGDDWEDMFTCTRYDEFWVGKKYYKGAYNWALTKEILSGGYQDKKIVWDLVRNANQALKLNQEYRSLLYNTRCKLPYVEEFIEKMNMKCLTFGKSIEMADELQGLIPNSIAIHSKIKTKMVSNSLLYEYGLTDKPNAKSQKVAVDRLGLLYIKQFNDGTFTTAHSAKKIIEGLDIKGAQALVNYGFDSNRGTANQKRGRINRAEMVDNGLGEMIEKVAYVLNVYCVGTKEENWLGSSQYKVAGIREIESLNEIEL